MSTEPARLLVVDDQDASRFVKSQILRRAGHAVVEARTGGEALAMVQSERPELVILDVNLPDMSGFEVCRRIKERPDGPSVQVLHVTQTSVTDADKVRGLDHGADMYLVEPVSGPVLLATVRALLRVRRAEANLEAAFEREREARAEAERANRTKDEFVAMVSHELRTPLNAMTGWIWQLKRGVLDEEGQRHAVDVLDRNARVQVQLINDLLDVSRISAGKLDMELKPVDIRPVVLNAADTALDSPAHARKNITLDAAGDSAIVMGDAARLQQVVTNLLNNAFQFTPPGGRITLRCGSENGGAFIRVTDTGAGIDPAFLPHVFERFRQARAVASGRERGLGLGLAIVRYLVEQHEGQIAIESPGVGLGTTCTITIPLLDAGADAIAETWALPASSLAGLHLLVVEDDPDAREFLQSVLSRHGATVDAVDCGTAAEAHALSSRFDVLVSDIGLPDFSGVDLLKRLRSRGYAPPAVAVTAFATEDDRRRLLAGGFLAHVAKPVDPDRLVRSVAKAAATAARPTTG
jgi:signal transduction histidine kinase